MNDTGNGGSPMFFVFVMGAVVGATLGLLYAPKPGVQTREQLAEFARRTREKAGALAGDVRQKMGA